MMELTRSLKTLITGNNLSFVIRFSSTHTQALMPITQIR